MPPTVRSMLQERILRKPAVKSDEEHVISVIIEFLDTIKETNLFYDATKLVPLLQAHYRDLQDLNSSSKNVVALLQIIDQMIVENGGQSTSPLVPVLAYSSSSSPVASHVPSTTTIVKPVQQQNSNNNDIFLDLTEITVDSSTEILETPELVNSITTIDTRTQKFFLLYGIDANFIGTNILPRVFKSDKEERSAFYKSEANSVILSDMNLRFAFKMLETIFESLKHDIVFVLDIDNIDATVFTNTLLPLMSSATHIQTCLTTQKIETVTLVTPYVSSRVFIDIPKNISQILATFTKDVDMNECKLEDVTQTISYHMLHNISRRVREALFIYKQTDKDESECDNYDKCSCLTANYKRLRNTTANNIIAI